MASGEWTSDDADRRRRARADCRPRTGTRTGLSRPTRAVTHRGQGRGGATPARASAPPPRRRRRRRPGVASSGTAARVVASRVVMGPPHRSFRPDSHHGKTATARSARAARGRPAGPAVSDGGMLDAVKTRPQRHLARAVRLLAGHRLRRGRSRHVHPDHHHPLRDRQLPAGRLHPLALRSGPGAASPMPARDPSSATCIWFLLAGLWMAIAHVVTGVLLCLTIIGIPLGLADFKLAAAAIAPLGKDIVRHRRPPGVRRL